MIVYTLSEVIVYSLRADTGVCPYDGYLSMEGSPPVVTRHDGKNGVTSTVRDDLFDRYKV